TTTPLRSASTSSNQYDRVTWYLPRGPLSVGSAHSVDPASLAVRVGSTGSAATARSTCSLARSPASSVVSVCIVSSCVEVLVSVDPPLSLVAAHAALRSKQPHNSAILV